MDDWRWLGAARLGRKIGEGEVDPRDLAEVFLSAAEGQADIFARLTPDRARAEAAASAARARAGHRRGPLDGVPLSWKDLFDTAGVATEGGSALLKDRVPDRDAEVLDRATSEGLVCLGKTHQSELAFSGLGFNPKTATAPNRHFPGHAPGGSSSGAAASVTHGLAAAGIGSDTGGSVRLPAAWNGLVGLKTTSGSLPMGGVVPLCPSFDTIGPLTRCVEDAALIWSALSGRRVDLRGAAPGGLRLAILETAAMADLEPLVADGFTVAVERLRSAGVGIDRIEVPQVCEAMPLSATLFSAEAYGIWSQAIEADPEAMFAPVRERFRGGRDVAASDYVAAWARLSELRRGYRAATAGYDAVILPTCPILPPEVDRLMADADHYAERNLMTLRNTRIGNLMGLPGLSLPTEAPGVGLLVQTPPMSEARLLRLGAALEWALA